MKPTLFILLLLNFCAHAQNGSGAANDRARSQRYGSFTFTIDKAAVTSAGVYKEDSILVRTLWNAEKYKEGTYTKTWDEKMILGMQLHLRMNGTK